MIKIAIIEANKELVTLPESWSNSDFKTIIRQGVEYKVITAFEHYFTPNLTEQFDFIYSNEIDFERWFNLPVDIDRVEYDWLNNKAILHCNNDKTYSFDCFEEWTSQQCFEALQTLTEEELAEPVLDYPFLADERIIRVELSNAQITDIILNEQTRPLMDWAYHVPNKKIYNGLVMWFRDFDNDLLSPEQTEGLLISLGAKITFSDKSLRNCS